MKNQLSVTENKQSLQMAQKEEIIASFSVNDVLKQVEIVQELMKKVMKEGEHYGTIPGTKKPTLYKAGAEKLGFTFRLMPKFEIHKTDLENGHREYEVICELYHIQTGLFVGSGVGSCSTMESKYRYRVNKVDTGEQIPRDYQKNKGKYKADGYRAEKDETGQWKWYKVEGMAENPNIADVYNTVLKMAKKRAHIDAILTATAASDIFTQDMEDIKANIQTAEEAEIIKPADDMEKDDIVSEIVRLCINMAIKETNKPEDDIETVSIAKKYMKNIAASFDWDVKSSEDLRKLSLKELKKFRDELNQMNHSE